LFSQKQTCLTNLVRTLWPV